MNPYETSKKYHFSYCVDRGFLLDRLRDLYRDLLGADESDVLTLNFGDLEVHCVIIDENEDEVEEDDE